VDRDQTLEFARALIEEVWESFDSSAVARFYHRDVVSNPGRVLKNSDWRFLDRVLSFLFGGPGVALPDHLFWGSLLGAERATQHVG
jgi:hypothetical protein